MRSEKIKEVQVQVLATLYAVKMISTSRRTRRDDFAMRTDYGVRTKEQAS